MTKKKTGPKRGPRAPWTTGESGAFRDLSNRLFKSDEDLRRSLSAAIPNRTLDAMKQRVQRWGNYYSPPTQAPEAFRKAVQRLAHHLVHPKKPVAEAPKIDPEIARLNGMLIEQSDAVDASTSPTSAPSAEHQNSGSGVITDDVAAVVQNLLSRHPNIVEIHVHRERGEITVKRVTSNTILFNENLELLVIPERLR